MPEEPQGIDRTYVFGRRYNRTLIMWQEMMLHAMHGLDEEHLDEFVILLVRPEGNVRIMFRPEAPLGLPDAS